MIAGLVILQKSSYFLDTFEKESIAAWLLFLFPWQTQPDHLNLQNLDPPFGQEGTYQFRPPGTPDFLLVAAGIFFGDSGCC